MGPLCPCHTQSTPKKAYKKGTRGISWGPLLTLGPPGNRGSWGPCVLAQTCL
ncbi:unnamed protein product [Staurois parvus]|uniref:Uncharacterized protein n=1 Tax=Staurois parvus TaxID=386267 RepID=A0ABN9B881_9NEOB|nr:unnamed protein product [Staurois parvus]